MDALMLMASFSPFGPLVLGFFLGALFLGLFSFLLLPRRRGQEQAKLGQVSSNLLTTEARYSTIFSDMDLGMLLYNEKRHLQQANPAAHQLLGTVELPQTLDDFLAAYGEENGLRARFHLSKSRVQGVWQGKKRSLQISLKAAQVGESEQRVYLVLLQDITEQEQQESQRKAFVANVSHELKTPLTTIMSYTESLLDWGLEEKNKDGLRKDLQRIHDDATRMKDLVTDLLLLSSIDSHKHLNRFAVIDLDPVVARVVEGMQLQAEEKGLSLSYVRMAKLPKIFADSSGIERIVTNLLSNALKYTEKGGQVKVYTGRLVDSVYVKVSDSGCGIEERHVKRIFERFYRVDTTGSRQYGGTGLGLAIAQELSQIHEGELTVQTALGQGSSFSLIIPSVVRVYYDTLIDIRAQIALTTVLRQAAEQSLVAQLQEQGEEIETLSDLVPGRMEELLQFYRERLEKT